MCILCVIQKWSRRVATMLPWLVIPLIGLWALSQLLPPAFRFEITSPRLACVFVLLVTLFWYEVLMPQLSAWRLRRNAMLRERKRFEAIELQKLKKTAMRCCRNCLTPYRDQNPGGGGRFMCSYCGHVSKRPVLDLPALPGKMLNGQGWTDNGWMCRQEWLENGNWSGGSITGRSTYLRKNRNGMFGGDESCLAEKSYSGGVIFACRLLTSFFLSIRWLWRKIFRFSSSRDESSSDVDQRRMLTKRGENGAHCQESRGEKARRKAEEKRQARLEKELLEEEERKQREEVARLVEEQRRLRDEMMEAEKDHSRSSSIAKEKDTKKEADKKRQERRKEKDRCSSKSNSDAEELEKRAGKETEWKRELDKNDRQEHQRRASEHLKGHYTETGDGHGMKNSTSNNVNRTITSNRYFDRMKGTFLSSSKAFTGGSFFGKRSTAPVAVNKEKKSGSSGDFAHTSSQRRDFYPPEQASGKPFMNGDDRKINRPVLSELQPITQPKKSWHQLFTCSPPGPASSNANVISRPNIKPPAEVQNLQFPSQTSSIQTFDNPISFGLPSQFTIPTFPNRSASSSFGFSTPIEPILPRRGEVHHEFIPEATELFEDLRYVPDPVSLLGPVSESLDNFQLDLGAGFATNMGAERRPHALKNASSSSEVNKPSPIESPLSRSRVADDKHTSFNQFQSTPMGPDVLAFPAVDATACEKGTWQMWKSSPLGQEGLGLVGGSARWFLPPETNISNKEDFMHPSPQRATGSLFSNEYPLPPGTYSPRKAFRGNGQSGATFSPVAGPINHDPWSQNAFFSGRGDQFSLQLHGEGAHNEMTFGSPTGSVTDHSFEQPPANCWSKDELSSVEVNGMRGVVRPSVGGQFLKDVQFENKEVTF